MFELGSLVSGAWSGPPPRFANVYINSFIELVIVTCTVPFTGRHQAVVVCITREPRCLCGRSRSRRVVLVQDRMWLRSDDTVTHRDATQCRVTLYEACLGIPICRSCLLEIIRRYLFSEGTVQILPSSDTGKGVLRSNLPASSFSTDWSCAGLDKLELF